MRSLSFLVIGVLGCSSANPGRGHTTGSTGSSTGSSTGGTSGGTTGSSTGGTTGTSTGGTTGGTGGGDVDGGTDPNCGVQNFTLQKGLPPDLLIILDRSGSMTDPPPSGGGTKWDQMTAAINTTVSSLQGQIKWGLEMFPHDNDCGVSASVDVPVAANNASAITAAIAGTSANGSTPTTAAINAGAQYLSTVSDSNPKYILLATDGEPNCSTGTSGGTCSCPSGTTAMGTNCCIFGQCFPCTTLNPPVSGGPDEAAAEQAVASAATAGVHTFVIGIATDSGADNVLNQMATNGLEARPGSPLYYPVANQNDLVTTINTIAGQIISCSFALQMAPPNPDFVSVQANSATVPKDTTHMNGWDYGPGNMSIQFYGAWCTQLQGGTVNNIEAIFECGPVS